MRSKILPRVPASMMVFKSCFSEHCSLSWYSSPFDDLEPEDLDGQDPEQEVTNATRQGEQVLEASELFQRLSSALPVQVVKQWSCLSFFPSPKASRSC